MATHDYVISNASGAAVRADLNNALAAIVSNNSNATEPSTTYAYMLWADTGSSPPVMKLRNAANDGWVTLFQLDGEWSSIAFEDGSAAAPSIYFKDSGTDTGLFSGGTDQVNITTGGIERVEWGASEVVFNDGGENYDFRIEGDTNANLFFVDASADRVGIGTTSVSSLLHLSAANSTSFNGADFDQTYNFLRIVNTTDDKAAGIYFGIGSNGEAAITAAETSDGETALVFGTRGGGARLERARLDYAGRLLVGTSSTSAESTVLLQGNSSNSTFTSILALCRGSAPSSDGSPIGRIQFSDNGHVASAVVEAVRDGGTWTAGSSQPSRLVFSTTADGASSPTERMRITQAGFLKATSHNTYVGATSNYHEFVTGETTGIDCIFRASSASYASEVIRVRCNRAATSIYTLALFESSDGGDTEFNLRGDGQAYADGSWNGGGADYAEYFEWSDGNPDEDDRRGISVVLDGEKIRPAVDGEDPIGVISGNPSVVGDAAWNKWSGKYLRDDYGTYIQEDYEVEDEDGNTVIQQRRKLNPAYDPDQEYVSREQRPEWDCVGLMGKLRIRKGQPTGSRWIKMRDISDSVEEWLVR